MPRLFEVLDEHDRPLALCGFREGYYVLPGEALVPFFNCIAWCPTCFAFETSEHLATMKEIEEGFLRIYQRLQETSYFSESSQQYVARKIAEMGPLTTFHRIRKSGPRCLACRQCGISPLQEATITERYIGLSWRSAYTHPVTGARIWVATRGHASIAGRVTRYYTPEGIELNDTTVRMLKLNAREATGHR